VNILLIQDFQHESKEVFTDDDKISEESEEDRKVNKITADMLVFYPEDVKVLVKKK
jgi:hypothetical protein